MSLLSGLLGAGAFLFIIAALNHRGTGNAASPALSKRTERLIKRFEGPSREPLTDGLKALAAVVKRRLGSRA